MNAILKSETDQVLHQNPGLGGRLRIERERRGLPLERVAAQLHLGADMVSALEADDYDKLPGAVFVKGYVRNYARLLGIPAEPLLAELSERCPDEECSKFVTGNVRQEVRSSHVLMRLITAAIVLGLIALLGLWWWNYVKAPEQTEASAPTGQVVAPTDVAETPVSTAPAPTPPAQAVPSAAVVGSESRSAVTEKPLAAPAPAVTASVPTGSREATPSVPIEAVEPAPPSGKVVIEFIKPCWVDIRGADDSFKMFGEFRKGRKELGGHGPYKFIIGKTSAVRLSVNGKPYSILRHSSGNVARFELDPMKVNLN
ncbi:MAG TPA: helix-turn-helix domain-containing protein [Chromatiaceae bacterium]|nr:helix-turn-helix domain-containing protein [Chromatiaceae bacterium]